MSKKGLTARFHFPLKFKVILALVGLAFGLMILSLSLITVSYQVMGQHYGARTFYLSQPILPDHIFYPILMLMDRFELYRGSGQKRFDLHLIFAEQRMWASEQLVYKGQDEMAVITAVKGQKYLLASRLAIKDLPEEQQPAAKLRLENALTAQLQTVANLEKSLSGVNTNPLSDLRAQQQILLSQLQAEQKTSRESPPLQ